MEAWALKGMQRWPNVPALFGWLGLDRRGRWLIRGEPITRPQIIETIGRNYAADGQGRWYFQNGPQRGYVTLDYAPLVLRAGDSGDGLIAHEDGALLLDTDLGPGLLLDKDLPWALEGMATVTGQTIDEGLLAQALQQPSGALSGLLLKLLSEPLEIIRLDAEAAPAFLGYDRLSTD
jgi:hypothetical protein